MFNISVCLKCVFPFEYQGKEYISCADHSNGKMKICAAQVYPNNTMMPGRFKVCPPKGCFMNTTTTESSDGTPTQSTMASTSGQEDSTVSDISSSNQETVSVTSGMTSTIDLTTTSITTTLDEGTTETTISANNSSSQKMTSGPPTQTTDSESSESYIFSGLALLFFSPFEVPSMIWDLRD